MTMAFDSHQMDDQLYAQFCDLIYKQCGIALGPHKKSLVVGRIGRRIRALDLKDAHAYLSYIMDETDQAELTAFLDVITTNTTHFFREAQHFEMLSGLLERWFRAGKKLVRIWCSAASTGEEPYTLAMTADPVAQKFHGKVTIFASDISTQALDSASRGIYSTETLREVPDSLREHYFHPVQGEGGSKMVVDERLKSMLSFSRINLAYPPYRVPHQFDVIFCRNVMIYFDQAMRERVIQGFEAALNPGGVLFVGHTESLRNISHGLEARAATVFYKPFRARTTE